MKRMFFCLFFYNLKTKVVAPFDDVDAKSEKYMIMFGSR